ncbi:MAG: tetraacyldisaccharide 4'-kinase [Cyanobacteriota bacterium]|nr:tetraacyldisaccharide 4'-kinase [Cyanobacteriota bacterium]
MLATPRFWYLPRPTLPALLLRPLGWLYGLGVWFHRRATRPVWLPAAVVAVGNLTLGGSGKTPVVIGLAAALQHQGWRVAVLLRGYGAGARLPRRVVPADGASQVGDEALEIQAALPGVAVWVGRDRIASGRAAIAAGAELLLLDDGLQHWRLGHDVGLSVLDRHHGLGNGLLFPAGPLRERQGRLGHADLLVLTGAVPAAAAAPQPPPAWPPAKPWIVLSSWIEAPAHLLGKPLLAFCGIGLPEKFFAALDQAGLQLMATAGFPDHHPYAPRELEGLQRRADAVGATLVTTVKDWQRLPDPWQQRVQALPLALDARALGDIAAAVERRLPGNDGRF